MKDKRKNSICYQIVYALMMYAFVMSVGYNIYQASIIKIYEDNLNEFLQEIIDLRNKK